MSNPIHADLRAAVDRLQAQHDRLSAYRGRALRYFDECPDGDPRKAGAEARLREINERIGRVERELDAAAEAAIAAGAYED